MELSEFLEHIKQFKKEHRLSARAKDGTFTGDFAISFLIDFLTRKFTETDGLKLEEKEHDKVSAQLDKYLEGTGEMPSVESLEDGLEVDYPTDTPPNSDFKAKNVKNEVSQDDPRKMEEEGSVRDIPFLAVNGILDP